MILEIILIALIVVLMVFVWIKTRSLNAALAILRVMIPTLKELAAKTDTQIDDKIVAYLDRISSLDDSKVSQETSTPQDRRDLP